MIIPFPNAGSAGVVKDLSVHELPPQAWTDASNVRFLDGYARSFLGHGQVYGTPAVTPLHVVPVNVGSTRYWLYAGANKVYAVANIAGTATHTNLTRQTAGADVDYAGTPNAWTSAVLSGIPIINAGNNIDPPQQWDLDVTHRMTTLANWPADTWCKAIRGYKNYLIALNVTKGTTNFGYMVKWSSPADPGGVPATWNPADQTQDAGEFDLAEGGDQVIDGLQLRDSFMIYKEQSVWRMDFTGGPFVFRFQKVLGVSGAMNRNCIVEVDGFHFVLTGSDVIVHDGQSALPVLDKVARRALFQDMDTAYNDRSFVFKNPFLNEVFVCYTSIGATSPNKALVWNYKDKTVSYRDIPNLNHANYGTVDNTLSGSWAADNDAWESDLTAWNGPDFSPNTTRVLMASNASKLYMLDASNSFDGLPCNWYLERRGLSFGKDDGFKTITGVRPRIAGNAGGTVNVQIGGNNTDPYADPEYPVSMTYTIGQTIACDGIVSYRYPAIRFSSGTAQQARLDSFDIEISDSTRGRW
jgi:hypothetical protein